MATREYCTADDLTARASQAGVLAAADDDADGVLAGGETAAAVHAALEAAAAAIDAAIEPVVQDDPSGNAWLRHAAVALAVEHLAARRGGVAPPSLVAAADRVRADLAEVRAGRLRIPGLSASESLQRGADAGRPRAWSPFDRPPVTKE
ncbi:MAG: phage protein Gp36 family protein [Planctomycetia bacterium]